ncbi:putative sulfate exporter family transporter [Brevibacterium sp. BRM-1]|uniref:YeiH family protein n=1 Tax=Brevibacterium sp. BRM-1 TaxID=2999062 RepID=UPI00227E75E3|nr:putative sulfate exporter family transporter [Brevibacterium sp. BRM-1]WAL40080.1 putative sulfate exporter family transporter [Brevibacterium sp. BRM-1]
MSPQPPAPQPAQTPAPHPTGPHDARPAGASAAADAPAPWPHRLAALLPGLALCAAAAALAVVLSGAIPFAGSVLIAIVLGALLRNLVADIPAVFAPGIAVTAKTVLRLGIVLLGTKLVLGDILDLGWGAIVLVVVVVGVGLSGAALMGRWLGVGPELSLLIGCGFSICGAAAVAGAQATLRAKKEDTAAAVALVVLFGTLMIAVVPGVAALTGLSPRAAGLWGGASTHEVAQVVAVGGILGPEALEPAVLVKLARVLMLAPVMAVLGGLAPRIIRAQRAADAHGRTTAPEAPGKRPPIVPLWVLGFALAALVRTLGWLPAPVVGAADTAQTWLLTAAMFALGCGVHVRSLLRLGLRPLLLAALTTLLVAVVAFAGVALLG